MNVIKSKLRNRLSWEKTEKLMYVRINLDILNREVDYSSITNPVFDLGSEDEEDEELPSAWREAEDDPEEAEQMPARVARSTARAAALANNKEKAVAGAPRAMPVQVMGRDEGRRAVRPPRAFDNLE